MDYPYTPYHISTSLLSPPRKTTCTPLLHEKHCNCNNHRTIPNTLQNFRYYKWNQQSSHTHKFCYFSANLPSYGWSNRFLASIMDNNMKFSVFCCLVPQVYSITLSFTLRQCFPKSSENQSLYYWKEREEFKELKKVN